MCMMMKVIFNHSIDVVSLKLIKNSEITVKTDRVSDHDTAIRVFQEQIGNMDREHFCVICLDSKGVPTNYSVAHVGTLNNTLISNREIFKVAVKSNASSILVAHNHPSGDVTPSNEDVNHTEMIVKAGKILGIPVLDHLIVSTSKGLSIRNQHPEIFN